MLARRPTHWTRALSRSFALCLMVFSLSGATSLARAGEVLELKRWTDGDKPPFILSTIDGARFNLATSRDQVILVHFFATWCEPCREELPALRRLVAGSAGGRLAVVAISVAEVPLRVKRFLEQTPVSFPVLLDSDRAVAKAWGVNSLPTTFVLDGKLKTHFAIERDFDWDRLDVDDLLRKLSAAPTRPVSTLDTIKQTLGRLDR